MQLKLRSLPASQLHFEPLSRHDQRSWPVFLRVGGADARLAPVGAAPDSANAEQKRRANRTAQKPSAQQQRGADSPPAQRGHLAHSTGPETPTPAAAAAAGAPTKWAVCVVAVVDVIAINVRWPISWQGPSPGRLHPQSLRQRRPPVQGELRQIALGHVLGLVASLWSAQGFSLGSAITYLRRFE